MNHNICVCGAGTMGSGIAQAAAQSGLRTMLYELNAEVLQKAQTSIRKSLDTLVEKKKLTILQGEEIYNRISFVSSVDQCKADIIIEAIIEKPAIKTELFHQLAAVNGDDTIFATNTSSLSVTALAKEIKRPERFIGMHFFNPATIMKLVEIVHTSFTNDKTIDMITALAKQMGKTPVICKDAPGFIVNRVARPYYIESLRVVEEHGTDVAVIDRLLEASGFKMGPFKLMDLIGNDVNYAVSCSVHEQLGKPNRLKPSYIQEEKVKNGELGKKTGKGYYNY